MVAEILEMFNIEDPDVLVGTTCLAVVVFSLFSVFFSAIIDDWRDETAHIASKIIICANLFATLVMTFFLTIGFYASFSWIIVAVPLSLLISGTHFFMISERAFDIYLRTYERCEERSNFKFIKPEK